MRRLKSREPTSIFELEKIVREGLSAVLPGDFRVHVDGDGSITINTDIRVNHEGKFEVIVPYDLPFG